MLFNGEEVGNGQGPECDVAVDPIDGTTLMSKGMPNALAVLAVSERGTMFDPSAVFYMEKIATGPEAAAVSSPLVAAGATGGSGQAGRGPSRKTHSCSATSQRPSDRTPPHGPKTIRFGQPSRDGSRSGTVRRCPVREQPKPGRPRRHPREDGWTGGGCDSTS